MLKKSSSEFIDDIRERVKSPTVVDVLTEAMMWEQHGPLLWNAERFEGLPFFYPVYKYKNYYSYSQLALIIKKGRLNLNPEAYRQASSEEFTSLSHENPIDSEIKRIGGAYKSTNTISEPADYVNKVVEALRKDVSDIENGNPGYTNIVMCGGKDSLNLLLLPWKNPVIAVSAEPNYSYVCSFVAENNLDVDVLRLNDSIDNEFLKQESAELCCRFNAMHWRWGYHLSQISDMFDHKIIIWKGQIGDLYMSTRWKTYSYGANSMIEFLTKVYGKMSPFFPEFLNDLCAKLILPNVERRLWDYGANAQGAHLGYIRSIADCLVLSAYHGKYMSEILKTANLGRVAQRDIRNEIGAMLLGREVIYPIANPTPGVSSSRKGIHHPDLLIDLLRNNDIDIMEQRE